MTSRTATKAASFLIGVLLVVAAAAQPAGSQPPENLELRARLIRLLADGKPEQAVAAAQRALAAAPADAAIRFEFIELHLFLARSWVSAGRYEDALTALDSVTKVEPANESAARMSRDIRAARNRATDRVADLNVLLAIERFDDALALGESLATLRADSDNRVAVAVKAARLGVADDNYLARNFSEAFAMYERVLADEPNVGPDVHARWAISLALALSESDASEAMDADAAGRLLARAIDVLRKTNQPATGQILGAMLAERAGEFAEAAKTYAEALGAEPSGEIRTPRERCAALRPRAIDQLRSIYATTPTQRRTGDWLAAGESWVTRSGPHFDVFARRSAIADRVLAAAEYHFKRIAQWIGHEPSPQFEPRIELRIYATPEDFRRETGAKGITTALSRSRVQDGRVILRKIEAHQGDPWLLSATIPHELTHILLTDMSPLSPPPLTLDEGIALLAEPPARRLMYARLAASKKIALEPVLNSDRIGESVEDFYASADVVTQFALAASAAATPAGDQPPPIARLLRAARSDGVWHAKLGFDSSSAMNDAWKSWQSAWTSPPRMPLMILVEPAAEHRKKK